MSKRDDRIRERLASLAGDVRQWKDALDSVSESCTCVLPTEPGYLSMDLSGCPVPHRRCRSMQVLTVRTHMGLCRILTRHLSAADIPPLVDALDALMREVPTTTDWKAFNARLTALLATGRDPCPHTTA